MLSNRDACLLTWHSRGELAARTPAGTVHAFGVDETGHADFQFGDWQLACDVLRGGDAAFDAELT